MLRGFLPIYTALEGMGHVTRYIWLVSVDRSEDEAGDREGRTGDIDKDLNSFPNYSKNHKQKAITSYTAHASSCILRYHRM